MTKRLDEDAFRFSETAYDKAIRKMEEMSTQKMSKITGGLGGLF